MLPPFSHWSGTQQKLFFSSLITFECFAIALFHMVAWGHREPWYGKARPAALLGAEGAVSATP